MIKYPEEIRREDRQRRLKRIWPACPRCGSHNTTRMQWVDNPFFEYWTCWDCESPVSFVVKIDWLTADKLLGFTV